MVSKSILQLLRDEVNKATKKEFEKLNQESDEIKRQRIIFNIQKIQTKIFFNKLQKYSNSDFEKLIQERGEELAKQHTSVMNQIDSTVFDYSSNPDEFEKYKKLKKMNEKHTQELFEMFNDINASKKVLERFLTLQLITQAQIEVQTLQNSLEYNEFLEGINIVKNRLGFDNNWLVGLSLIQLHENLIKKKISQLGGGIKEEESVSSLIAKLASLIKQKEQRDVRLQLEMSSGLKKIRDIITHEGFKHKITKKDLNTILKEIKRLETILYPQNK